MKLAEAYTILELTSIATPEEVKKKYRELTKKFHPDINKDPAAEDKFKKINEAYQVINTGKSTDPVMSGANNATGNWNPFSRQQQQQFFEVENIDIRTTISFTESVLGTRKELKFNRKVKCVTCGGQGIKRINNGCAHCGGQGKTITEDKGTIFITACGHCRGAAKTENCKACEGAGCLEAESSIHVSIPGGITTGTPLRLANMGNFMGTFMFSVDQYSDAHLHVTVQPEPGLSLEGRNVVSKLEVSLLEALRGCTKQVKTIIGHSEVEIKSLSRNGDIILISKLGVSRQGDHKVVLDVKYPKDINKIIDILIKEGAN